MRKNILKWWSGLQQNQSRQAARDAWRASFNVTDETQWAVYMNGVRAGHVTEQMIRRIEHLLQDDKRLRYWHLGRVGEGLSTVLNVMSELVRFLAVGFATVSGLVVFAALCSSTEVARWLQLAAAQPADTARTLSTAATGISLVMMAATIAYLMGRINEASPDPDPYRDAWIDRVRIAAQIVTLGALSCELPGLFLRRYFYLIDRATVERSPAGVCVAFPVIPAVADFRDGPLDDRFLFDVERSLDAVCAAGGAERLKTMQAAEPAEDRS